MKTVENLLKASNDKKLGNHRVSHLKVKGDNVRKFYYYQTAICTVNDTQKTFEIDDSYGSQSTSRACNSYRRELQYSHEELNA